MNKNDIAYAAGLFDADGSITISKWKRKIKISPCYNLRINISSMNLPILYWFKDNFGGFVRIAIQANRTNRKYNFFCWEAKANIAANFLRKIIPELQIKKLRAELALVFQTEVKKNTGYQTVSPESLQRREQFKNQIFILNHTYSKIEFPNGYKIGYISGLLDGDGSIFISIKKSRINPAHYLRVDIGSHNRSITSWLRNNFNGSILVRKPYFSWSVERNLAENILQQTLPYLRIKKPQAKLALQFRKEKKQNRGRRLTVKTLECREQFRQQMFALNRSP